MDISIIVHEIVEEFKEKINDNEAVIDIQDMCKASVIPFQFRQLVHNLLSNSLKFTKKGTTPHISITSKIIQGSELNEENIPPKKKYCLFSFSDNGIGFNQEYKEKIFEVFQRLHTKQDYPGTGIGMAIVKKIVDNHNGYVDVSSKIGKGTTFKIYIPIT